MQDVKSERKFTNAQMLKYGLLPVSFASVPAFAAIDASAIANEITGASVAIDTVGVAIIGVVTGMVVIGLIISLLRRNS